MKKLIAIHKIGQLYKVTLTLKDSRNEVVHSKVHIIAATERAAVLGAKRMYKSYPGSTFSPIVVDSEIVEV